MISLQVPKSDCHNQVMLTVTHPLGVDSYSLDDSNSTINIPVPDGVSEDDVEEVAQFVGGNGQPDPSSAPSILKAKAAHAQDQSDSTNGDASPKAADAPVGDTEVTDVPAVATVGEQAGETVKPEEPATEVTGEIVVQDADSKVTAAEITEIVKATTAEVFDKAFGKPAKK